MDLIAIQLACGLATGLAIGLLNERLTSLVLEQVLRRDMSGLRSLVLFFSMGFYVLKYCLFGLIVYRLVMIFAPSGSVTKASIWPLLLGFAFGIIVFQISHSVIMLLRPRLSSEHNRV